MTDILLILIMKHDMHGWLQRNAIEKATDTLLNNDGFSISMHVDRRPVSLPKASCKTHWSKIAVARNRVLKNIQFWDYKYLLWVDADVEDYSCNLPSRLIECNPDGITAPLVLIQGTEIFYDVSASIIKGQDHIRPEDTARIVGRNVGHEYPYWPTPPTTRFVEMDCVGTITMVPTEVYMNGIDVEYTDHPSFTDHYDICKMARSEGRKVGIDRETIAYHADLPKYGEAWH